MKRRRVSSPARAVLNVTKVHRRIAGVEGGDVEAEYIKFVIPSLHVQCDLDENHMPYLGQRHTIHAKVVVRPGLDNSPHGFKGTPMRQLVGSHFVARYALLGNQRVCDEPPTNAETIARVRNLNIDRRPVSIPTMLDVVADLFGRPLTAAIQRELVDGIHHAQRRACDMIKSKRVHDIYEYKGPYRPGKPAAYRLLRNKAALGLEQRVSSSDELARLERGLRRAVARHR
jgi:nucleoside-diphosphate-sugar epimerase